MCVCVSLWACSCIVESQRSRGRCQNPAGTGTAELSVSCGSGVFGFPHVGSGLGPWVGFGLGPWCPGPSVPWSLPQQLHAKQDLQLGRAGPGPGPLVTLVLWSLIFWCPGPPVLWFLVLWSSGPLVSGRDPNPPPVSVLALPWGSPGSRATGCGP